MSADKDSGVVAINVCPVLTPLELQVLRLLVQGTSTKAIALRLNRSNATVMIVTQRILCTFQVFTRVHLALRVRALGMFPDEPSPERHACDG